MFSIATENIIISNKFRQFNQSPSYGFLCNEFKAKTF